MKYLKIKSLFLILLIFFIGTLMACKSSNIPIQKQVDVTTNVIEKETIRDTFFETKKDSSYYKAWLKCKNGKVVVVKEPKKGNNTNYKLLDSRAGTYLKSPKVSIKDNILEVDCYAEAQKLFAQWKDTYKIEQTTKTTRIPYPVEKPLTFFQKLQIWFGRILLVLLLTVVVATVLRWKKII